MDENKLLPLILEYKMDKSEAKAWKVAIMYLQLAQKYIPDYKHYRIGKGDPRKTSLFRYCYKLTKECEDLLADYEYRMYISAQLQILKNINCGDCHAIVGPQILVGPKAWKRWLMWKRIYDKKQYMQTHEELGIVTHQTKKIIEALKETKKFLVSKIEELNKKNIIDVLESRTLFRWVILGHVSPYYLVLSPVAREWLESSKMNLLENFTIDLDFYKSGIDNEVKECFQREFAQ